MKEALTRRLFILLACLGAGAVVVLFTATSLDRDLDAPNHPQPQTNGSFGARSFKVLHIMSYHSPWEWTDNQLAGFKAALNDLDVEYKVIQVDAKRRNSPEWFEQIKAQAFEVIEEWKPDLVFSSDDDAQTHVCNRLAGGSIPHVFCGVNAAPAYYGYTQCDNVTGVIEREHFVQTVRLVRRLSPDIKQIAIVTDQGEMWKDVIARINEQKSQLDGVEVVPCAVIETYQQYKDTLRTLENEVDAVGFLGVFEFKDANGNNVALEEVTRWTAENSKLPDFAFWEDRVYKGTLCTVTVSAWEQGNEAGKLARKILIDGVTPSSLPIRTTVRGEPFISLARARKLGITPVSDLLLACKVVTEFNWGSEE